MEVLLKSVKDLEKDFVNSKKEYRSKMDLGISSLVTGDFYKAREMFNAAIEIDSEFPSAWLGKAFSEIALVEDENFNSLEIDEYLRRAMKYSQDITKYKVIISGCLAYRHAALIKKYVFAVDAAIKQRKEAQTNAAISFVGAIAGTTLTGKSKGTLSNVIGGSLIAGGAGYAVKSSLKSQELKALGNSLYSAALMQTLASAPIIYLCSTLIPNIQDQTLVNNLNVILDSWKDSVIVLYNKQRTQLVKKLEEFNFNDVDNIQLLLTKPDSIKEIGSFTGFMKVIGLSNHEICKKLDNLFEETLPEYFKDSKSFERFEIARKKKVKARKNIIYSSIAIGIALLLFMPPGDFRIVLPIFVDFTGIITGFLVYLFWYSTNEIKGFNKYYDELVSTITSTQIVRTDLNLNLINAKENDSDDSNLLGSE